MAARSNEIDRRTRCRALVGGFGVPGLRDLDFGRNFVSYSEQLDWPDHVVVEEIPSSALLVLHRLQELRPAKLVVVAAAHRWPDPPGTVRRYDLVNAPDGDMHEPVADAIRSEGDLDHSLALARQWGALPETVVIEVEPAETTLGLGFSEEVGASLDRILALVREELGGDRQDDGDVVVGQLPPEPFRGADPRQGLRDGERGGRAHDLVHDGASPPDPGEAPDLQRSSVRFDQLPEVEDLVLAARFHPGDPGRRLGGDWCDIVPLDDAWTTVLIGEVLGHDLDAAAMMSELRTAARAHSLREGRQPGRMLAHLDRVVQESGTGKIATALCLAVDARSGRVRLANAGHCPPLLFGPDGPTALCDQRQSAPLGGRPASGRPEASFSFPLKSTLLLLTSGLVGNRHRPVEGLTELGVVAGNAPGDPKALCDHVVMTAQAGLPAGEGGCLLAIRRRAEAEGRRATRS